MTVRTPVKEQREVGKRDCPRQEKRRKKDTVASNRRGESWVV